MRRARRRLASVTFYAQTFQKPARYFCYCPTGPSGRAGWGAPHGGGVCCMCNIGVFVRLFFGVSCGICAGAIVLTSCLVMHGRRAARRARGRAVAMPVCRGYVAAVVAAAVCRRRRVVATRRWTLVFAMVLVWPTLSWFALCPGCMYSESHQANDNGRNGDEREATTTKPTAARTVTRSPLNRRGMDD